MEYQCKTMKGNIRKIFNRDGRVGIPNEIERGKKGEPLKGKTMGKLFEL